MTALLLALGLVLSQAPAPGSGAPSGAPAEEGDVASRYDAALGVLLEGRLAEAAQAFERLAADPAAPAPLAERARALAEASRAMHARGAFVPRAPSPAAPPVPKRLDQRGRGELALYGTAFGLWAGIGTGVLLELEDPRAYAALALAGGGGALALATLGTRGRPVPAGRAQVIEAATSWSSLAGGLAAGIADADTRGVVGTTLGAGLAGLGTAVLLTRDRAPSSGDVALVNSGGIWGVAAGGLALLLVESPGEDAVLGTLLAGAGAGIGAGALAGTRVEISRGRSLLVDAGGLVGGLVGLSIPLFARSENPRAYGVSGLLGLGAGLAGGAWLTRGWDDDADADRRAGIGRLLPTVAVSGGEVRVGLAGTF